MKATWTRSISKDEAISKLQREHRRLQARIDAMYTDKLDGRIDNAFFDRKASEFRTEQCRVMRDIEAHQGRPIGATSRKASSCWSCPKGRRSCSRVSHQARSGNCWILYFRTRGGRTGRWRPNTGNHLI